MGNSAAIGEPAPTQDERTMATLAHALQIVGWFIAPLVILLIKRDSKFVSFHALQALLFQICYLVLAVVTMVLWFAVIFGSIMGHDAGHPNAAPPPLFFVAFPLIWLGWIGMWVLVLVMSIIYAVKAGRGEWAAYPILGGWARRILKI